MFYIGIDVAKRHHIMAVITKDGKKVIVNFGFLNTSEGFKQMLEKLNASGVTCENSKVALEATGHYSNLITAHLMKHGFEVAVANPLQTRNFARAQSIRKVKNDAVDSLALAQWLLSRNPTSAKPSSYESDCLKSIARFRTFQSQIISDSKRKVIAILDQVFPEYETCFSDIFGSASLAVLLRYPNAQALSRAHVNSLSRLLKENSRGRFGDELAKSLRDKAKDSFANNTDIDLKSFELTQLLSQIEFTKRQLATIDAKMKSLLDKVQSPITTIPGIGIVCAATILGEIGSVTRFKKPSSLVAFAGIDPSVYESGQFKGTKSHISKRGSCYLRWALWIAAERIRMFDPVFGEYYTKKRLEGKCHKVAISAVARKLCNTIFAVLSTNKPYVCPLPR